jgi:hypothetical protein
MFVICLDFKINKDYYKGILEMKLFITFKIEDDNSTKTEINIPVHDRNKTMDFRTFDSIGKALGFIADYLIKNEKFSKSKLLSEFERALK